MKIKNFLNILLLFISLNIFFPNILASNDATAVPKEDLVYEVTDISVEDTMVKISGWAFISQSQHYNSINDFSGHMELISVNDTLQYDLVFSYKDMTELMKIKGVRRCSDKEYNQIGSNCFYDYKYVGWEFNIPYTDLKEKSIYTFLINIHAKNANKKYKTFLYTIVEEKKKLLSDSYIVFDGYLTDSSFFVNHDYVYVKKQPATDNIYYGSKTCGNKSNAMYFEPYAQFNTVYDYKIIDNVHWYQVGIKEQGCKNNRLYGNEDPSGANKVWIASSFVEYTGYSFKMSRFKIAPKPEIMVENQTIYVGDTLFNPDNHVRAYDSIDGVIIPVRGRTNLNIDKVGTYYVEYSATNSKGVKATKLLYVYVIDRIANTPPIIYAEDRHLKQGDKFNPLDGVRALDLEDGDITNKIEVLNIIDTSITQTQELCFSVNDSQGLNAKKCVLVYIRADIHDITNNNTLRFIDGDRLFYRERIPSIWEYSLNTIRNALQINIPIQIGHY